MSESKLLIILDKLRAIENRLNTIEKLLIIKQDSEKVISDEIVDEEIMIRPKKKLQTHQ